MSARAWGKNKRPKRDVPPPFSPLDLTSLSSSSPSPSPSLSDFLAAQFAGMKQSNPGFPLLVREADGTPPIAYARYDKGAEASVALGGLDAAGVEAAVGGLVAKGEAMPRGAESAGALPQAG
jgi:NADH dehydrogenase (ubiquinone) 1 alpha subcomplex subunit 2